MTTKIDELRPTLPLPTAVDPLPAFLEPGTLLPPSDYAWLHNALPTFGMGLHRPTRDGSAAMVLNPQPKAVQSFLERPNIDVEVGDQDMRPALFVRWVAGDDPEHVVTFPFLVQHSGHRHTALRIVDGAPVAVHLLIGATGKLVYRARLAFQLPEDARQQIGELLLQTWSVLSVLRAHGRSIDPELGERIDAGLLDDEDADPGFRLFASQLRDAAARSKPRKSNTRPAKGKAKKKATRARKAATAAKVKRGKKAKTRPAKSKVKKKATRRKPAATRGKK